MPEIIAPNIGLSYGWVDGEDGWGGPMSENMRALDALLHLAVLSMDQAEPPLNAEDGDRYVVGQNPVGAWAEHAGHIAVRIEGTWRFYVPRYGYRARVATGGAWWFDGSEWIQDGGDGGGPGGETPVAGPRFYDIAISAVYEPEPGEVLAAIPLAPTCVLPVGAAGSFAVCVGEPPVETATYELRRAGASVGSISFAAGAMVGAFTVAHAATFTPGQVLTVVAISGGGMAGVGMTIRLTLMGASS